MVRFVIKRIKDGKFVTVSGHPEPYTNNITYAKTYSTREAAIADKCDNEYVTERR